MENLLLILEPEVKVTLGSVGADLRRKWQSHTGTEINPANREDESEMTDSCKAQKPQGFHPFSHPYRSFSQQPEQTSEIPTAGTCCHLYSLQFLSCY